MYPSGELKLLAARRERLRARIGRHRRDSQAAAGRIEEGVRRILSWRRALRLSGLLGAAGAGWMGWRHWWKQSESGSRAGRRVNGF